MAKKSANKHKKGGTKRTKSNKKARSVPRARIRVCFEGAIISMGTDDELSLCECPADARTNMHGVRTFMQQDLTVQQHMVSGLWAGGSRDLSSVTPRRVFCPHGMQSSFAKLGLITPGTNREWPKGSVQAVAMDDALVRIKSLRVHARFREARDADFCNELRMRCATRGMAPRINFCGNTEEMLYNLKQMQHSYWAMFFARLWYTVNMLAVASEAAYPISLGYEWNSNGKGAATVSEGNTTSRLKIRQEIALVAGILAQLVKTVTECTPCALKPWQGLNTHVEDMQHMRETLDRVHIFAATSKVRKYLPAGREFAKTRAIWLDTIERMLKLRVYYQCAMTVTSLMNSITLDGGLVDPSRVPFMDLAVVRHTEEQSYGYTIRTMEYKRVLETDQPLPCFVFSAFDNNTFVATVSRTTGDSPYLYQHPRIFWSSVQLSEDETVNPEETTLATFLHHGVATRAMMTNACGPDHHHILEECLVQGAYEQNMLGMPATRKMWDLTGIRVRPSLVAAKMDRMQNFDRLEVGEFVALTTRLLNKDDLSFYLQAADTLNHDWLMRSGYYKVPARALGHRMVKEHIAATMVGKFIATWAAGFRARRDDRATALQTWAHGRLLAHRAARRLTRLAAKSASRRTAYHQRSHSAKRIQRMVRAFLRRRAVVAWVQRHARAQRDTAARLCAAVLLLQRMCRGYHMQFAYKTARWMAVRLQALYRGARARRYVAAVRETRRGVLWYMDKVDKVEAQLKHLFEWERLVNDPYMMAHSLRDGTVPFPLLLSFPCVNMFACTVQDPVRLIVEAGRRLPWLVVTPYGLLHHGFAQPPTPPPRRVDPVAYFVPVFYCQ